MKCDPETNLSQSGPPVAPAVEFDGVTKSYDGKALAVKDVSFRMERGEFLTFLGPSGSGKTSCLMMLAGFESVTHGRILLHGREVNNIAPHKRDIGMVFQSYALFPHMNVADNIGYPLRVRGVDKGEIATRVDSALEAVKLAGFGERRVAQLSGGQQQRIALARALVFNPQLVLMDEPLSALDKELREEMQFEIRRLHTSLGISVVYVTHDQGEALVMSNRIAVLNGGTIQQITTPTKLYEEPCNSFVARFIGENNIFQAGVQTSSANGAILTVGGASVRCVMPAPSAPGCEIFLSVRPEAVMLEPHMAQCANSFQGQIQDVVYRGDHLRVRLAGLERTDLIAKVPKHLAATMTLETGRSIAFGWRDADCRLLTD